MLRNMGSTFFSAISLIAQHIAPFETNFRQQCDRMDRVMVISGREQKLYGVPQAIHDRVELRIQSSMRTAYRFGLPFFTPPLALSCTLTEVESMLRFSMSASLLSTRNTFSKVPSLRHLRKRV